MASVLSQIIMRGTIAERPAADTPGRLYFSTDESRMYRDNGTTWDEVSPVPGDHAASHALGGYDEVLLDPAQIDGTAIVEADPRLTDARTPTAHAETHGPEGSDPITGIAPTAHAETHALGGDDEVTLDPAQITGTAAVLADLNGYVDTTTFLNFRSDVFNGLIGSASASSDGPTVSDWDDSEVLRDFSTDADQWQTLETFSGIAGWPDPTVLANVIIHFNKLDAGTADLEVRAVYDAVEGDPIAFSLTTDYRSIVISFAEAELLNGGTDLEIQWRLQDPFDSYTGSISSNYRSIDVWTGYLPIYGNQRGAANGVASLDGDGLVPVEQLPVGAMGPTTDDFYADQFLQNIALAKPVYPAKLIDPELDSDPLSPNPPSATQAYEERIFTTPVTRDFSIDGEDVETFHTFSFSTQQPISEGHFWVEFDAFDYAGDPEDNTIALTFEIMQGLTNVGSVSVVADAADLYNPDHRTQYYKINTQLLANQDGGLTDVNLKWAAVGGSGFAETLTVRRAAYKLFLGGPVVGDDDARLTDARTPLAHAASHEDGGSDELELAPSQITGTAVVESTFAAKGDLLSATADNTPAILTVGTDGQILMANSAQTAGLEWVDNHAEQLRLTVKNMSGASIAKGKAVYIDGVSGNTPTIVLADASTDATSAYTLGLTGEPIDDGDTGFVITKGLIRNISTIGLTGGAPVWLSETAGEITATKPTQPAHGVLIGYAVRIHATVGEIYIFTQNGYELGELHDVLFGTTPVEKNVLSYDATATVWKNRTLADAGIASTAHASTHNAGGSDQMAIDAAAGTGSLRTLGTSSTSAAAGNHTHSSTETINVIIDGGGAAITTGVKADLLIPYAATITAARLLADQSGSIVVDIWKDTYANFPPTVADSITASAKPTLSSAQKSEDTTLTGWTTALAAGDYLRFNVDSATTVQRVTLALTITRTI